MHTFSVTDLPVGVRPGRGTRYRDVRVLAPVAFGARTDARIPWTVPRPEAVADGMLWWIPGVEIEDVREPVGREGLVVRVQVDPGVWLDRLRVPCDAVGVGLGEGSAAPPNWGARGGPRWAPANEHLWLVSRPGESDSATVRLEAPGGLGEPLIEVRRRGEWVQVVARFQSGARLRGWARQHHLRAADASESREREYVRAVRQPPPATCRRARPERNEYVGPARVSVGAIVYFGRGGRAWGTISEPAIVTVSWHHGTDWVRIVHVPGLRGDGRCPEVISGAWVARRAVSLSGEGRAGAVLPGSLLGLE